MKKSIMFAAVVALASQAYATGTPTPTPVGTVSVTGSGSNQVTSQSAAGSYVLGAGSSVSKASNIQSASAYVTGSGSLTTKPVNQYVSAGACLPDVKVTGTLTSGTVTSAGSTAVYGLSNASNVSTGAGTGGAAAGGVSVAEVAGKTTATAPNFNLSADGSAFSGVATSTQAGTDQTGPRSEGLTGSSYVSTASGSLFTYKSGNLVGDVKTVTTNVVTRSGDLTCPGTGCGGSTTVKAITTNATVEAGASGNAFADIKATFSKP